ncbi:YkvA family protein [Aeromicrobium stalagmiti]|uniref:YkvA family protein n=1 Tax=Aeromicrobium stalagmiti TaxID=2738988 RepID=UPI00156A2D84|nr:DUF1232 domain-containing protein [Aeromicrobium stalagmiti]
MIRDVAISVAVSLLVLWLLLLVALWWRRPGDAQVRDAMRLVPDVLALLGRLARNRSLPRGVRVRLWLLLGYLLMPIDLVPDFIPVIGYADDVVVVALALRSVVRRAGADALEQHWRGTTDGLAVIRRLAGVSPPAP